jgi:hypothetical protein
LPKAVAVAAASDGTPFILDNNGHVWAFARPYTADGLEQLPGLKDIKKIVPFGAIDEYGNVYTWGFDVNKSSWLNDGDGNPLGLNAIYTYPHMVKGVKKVIDLAAENYHFLALLSDGDVVEWGKNVDSLPPSWADFDFSRRVEVSETPKKLVHLKNVISLFVGRKYEFILCGDGNLYAWGKIDISQYKESLTKKSSTPQIMSIGPGATEVSSNGDFIVASFSNGPVHYWGRWAGKPSSLDTKTLDNFVDDIDNVKKIVAVDTGGLVPIIYIQKNGHAVLTPAPEYPCNATGCMSVWHSFNTQELRVNFGSLNDVRDGTIHANDITEISIWIMNDGAIFDGKNSISLSQEK